ncbi:transposase family protein [Nitriliruptoraceae bacterium ZYF776]|nr:transposase family protein [Profundirhabdus halotolerans]
MGGVGRRRRSRTVTKVVLVDLPVFGRPTRLRWVKRRWRCPRPDAQLGRGPSWSRRSARPGW